MKTSDISGSAADLSFALQLCVLRFPGRVPAPGEVIPAPVTDFIAAQLGLSGNDLLPYAAREETRHEHLADLRKIFGYRTLSGRGARGLREWIAREAEAATSNEDLARRFVVECRRLRTILPASSTIERLCADALVDAERRIEGRIAARGATALGEQLACLLEDTVDGRVTRFVWLRQFEVGANSRAANRLIDRLEYLSRTSTFPQTSWSACPRTEWPGCAGRANAIMPMACATCLKTEGYSHVSDQYAPFATQVIPATVSEAPYILDGLLMNEASRHVRQHFADTGGFTDHVFAACALLGYRFVSRIRDLPQKRLYAFNPSATPTNLRAPVGGKINEPLIERN